jgi:hypothetical protein
MTTPTTNITIPACGNKHESAKRWLQRRLRKTPSIQPSNDGGIGGLRDRVFSKRPRTAPSSGTGIDAVLTVAATSVNNQLPMRSFPIQHPSRTARPDAGIMRDVNAWLDASIAPSPPLMDGVSYWKKASAANAKNTAGIQHALPIVRGLEDSRPSLSYSHQVKSFRRRAKRIQMQMPLLVRNKSLRNASQKANRRSNSMPIFAIPYESTQQATLPRVLTGTGPSLSQTVRNSSASRPAVAFERLPCDELLLEQPRFRYGTPASTRTSEAEGSMERRMNSLFGRNTRSVESTRPSTAAARVGQEDSMEDLSDAPTYSSGPPPPSYRSRPASVLTTSSFGCIDGMNPAQRQVCQQRATLQRGMRCKLKKIAQSFTT